MTRNVAQCELKREVGRVPLLPTEKFDLPRGIYDVGRGWQSHEEPTRYNIRTLFSMNFGMRLLPAMCPHLPDAGPSFRGQRETAKRDRPALRLSRVPNSLGGHTRQASRLPIETSSFCLPPKSFLLHAPLKSVDRRYRGPKDVRRNRREKSNHAVKSTYPCVPFSRCHVNLKKQERKNTTKLEYTRGHFMPTSPFTPWMQSSSRCVSTASKNLTRLIICEKGPCLVNSIL